MTQRQKNRLNSLLPNGIPRWIRVWKAEGEGDNITVCFTGRYRGKGWFLYVGMNGVPFHPSHGICQHGESPNPIDCPNGWAEQIGRKCRHNPALGRRIRFEDLPFDCQTVVLNDYCALWDIPVPERKS
jgi:hypothetical protein